MRILQKIKSNKLLYTWMRRYIAVIFAVVAVNVAVQVVFVQISNANLNKNINETLSIIGEVYDNAFKQCEISAYSMLTSSFVKTAAFNAGAFREISGDNQREIMNGLSLVTKNNNFVQGVLLVFKDCDICLATDALYTKDVAFQALYGDYYASTDEWLEKTFNNGKLKEYKTISSPKAGNKTLLVYGYPDVRNSKPLTLIIEFNKTIFDSLMSTVKNDKQIGMLLTDNEGKVLYTYGSEEISAEAGRRSFLFGRYNTYSVKSSVLPYTYTFLTDNFYFNRQMIKFNVLFIFCCVACIIIGLIFAYYFSCKNYEPVHSLVQKLKSGSEGEKGQSYSFIENEIEKLIAERKRAEKLQLERKKTIWEQYIVQLLKNDSAMKTGFLTEKLDLDFEKGSFAVVLFSAASFGVFGTDNAYDDFSLSNFAVKNVFDEYTIGISRQYYFAADNMLICIVNFDASETDISCINANILKTKSFLNEHFDLELGCAVSGVSSDIGELKTLYFQADEALSYRFLTKNYDVLVYDELMNKSEVYFCSAKEQAKLKNLLSAGDSVQATAYLNDLIRESVENRVVDVRMMKLILLQLVNIILCASEKLYLSGTLDISEMLSLFTHSKELGTLEDVMKLIGSHIEKICEINRQQMGSAKTSKCEDIKDYILKNYANPNMTVSSVAAHFGLSFNYFSNFFKEQTGMGVTEYIIKCRIEKSKELLTGTNYSIAKIAEIIGFYSAAVYSRAFKRMEFITPGQYRKAGKRD